MKSVQLKKFKKYLISKGLEHKRTESSHEIWDYKNGSLPRPVIVVGKHNDVPYLHIKTTLKTLGISTKDFERDIKGF